VQDGAAEPKFVTAHTPDAHFALEPQVIAPGEKVTFVAQFAAQARYTWLFGDGTEEQGRVVRHRFADAEGTELDARNGAGRFRVLLHVADKEGHEDWAEQDVVVVAQWHAAAKDEGATSPGLAFRIFPGEWTELPDLAAAQPALSGEAPGIEANAQGFTHYAVVWDGFLNVPSDGGYSFSLIDRDGARLVIDGVEVAKTGPPFAQVCGSPGNAARYAVGALGLRAGKHALHVEGLHEESGGAPILLWQRNGLPLTNVPESAMSHARE
jgi:hypothetical protein